MRSLNLSKLTLLCGLMLTMSLSSRAQFVTNADSTATLNTGASWVGGVPAGAANIAVWDHTVQVNNTKTLGAPLSWAGIQVLDPATLQTIAADGNSLTLGASGIDLSQATNGLAIFTPVVLGAQQTWKVTNGLALTVNGIVSGTGPLDINDGTSSGIVNITNLNTYTGGTLIKSGSAGIYYASSLGTGGVTNNGNLELVNFLHAGVMINAFFVPATSIMDMANVNASFVFDGAWSGAGTVLVTNFTASGSTLTFGGAAGGNMANFTGSIVVLDNASATPSAGTLRFNNGGSAVNTGNSAMSINLGGTNPGSPGSTIKLSNRDATTTAIGQLTGGFGTEVTGQTSGSGTEIWSIGALNTSFTFGGAFVNQSSTAIAALTKVGTGTMTLTGTNTATGTTTISAGTLQIGDGNADGTLSTGPVANSATLAFDRPDNYSVSNNISGIGTLIVEGGGTQNYFGTNSSSGTTLINQGDLILGMTALTASPVSVASGSTFDVSQDPTFTLKQTLSGSGSVNGLLTAVSGSINPGGSGTAGTLTLSSGLTESGGINNQFALSTPTGTNDLLNVVGNLTLSGANNVTLTAFGGGVVPPGVYPLITYSGTLSGGVANLTVVAAGFTGTLTNITTTTPPEIAVIVAAAARGPLNLTWKGDGNLNLWNNISSNWLNSGTSYAFQDGDSVLFNNAGAPNTNINLVVSTLPASVIFSNSVQEHYTLSGSGSINGSVGLVKTNTGILTVLNTNDYTGPTIVAQGVLEVNNLGISGAASAIGAASGNATNLVFNGSVFKYSGPSTSTDHGATLNGSGVTVDVTNGANLTLSGLLTGPGALALTDTGTLTLPGDNTYNGGTVISNGVLALGSNNANNNGSGSSGVGPTNEPVTFAGGTLALYGYNQSQGANYSTFLNPLVVPAGQTGTLIMFPRGPINTGAGSGLFSSLSGSGTLNLEVNYVRDALSGDWSAFSGVINVTNYSAAGGDEMRLNNSFGYANATINLNGHVIMDSTLSANATINIGALNGVATAIIGPGNESEPGPTWCIGWNNQNSTYAGTIEDDNTAPGGHTSLIKVGTGTFTLPGGVVTNVTFNGVFYTTNENPVDLVLYTGDTTVSNGTVALIVPDALTNSPVVTLAAPTATIDATSMGYVDDTGTNLITNSVYEVVLGQTLNGLGTIRGNLQVDSGAIFNVGLPTGVFNVTSNASLSGTLNMGLSSTNSSTSSEVAAQTFTINSPTLNVVNTGPGLINGTTFTLFNHGVSGFASISLPLTDPTATTNYVWANNLASNGTITLTTGGVVAQTTPPHITFGASGNTLSLSWPSSYLGYNLQVQTNSLAVGVSTNWVTVPGSSSVTSTNITINPANPTVFYRLVQ